MQEHELENGHTVRLKQEYTLTADTPQLGLPAQTQLTVDAIGEYPDGIPSSDHDSLGDMRVFSGQRFSKYPLA